MSILEKRDRLYNYCFEKDCSECIFSINNRKGCKYLFLNDKDCIKAYDELIEHENAKTNVRSDGLMTIEEKEYYLNDYCNGTFCSECIFRDKAKGCKYSFEVDYECEKAYDELIEYENQCKSKGESNTTYWEVDGYGIIKADESMTKLIKFIIETKLSYSDFHKASLVKL